jgi:Cytochrome c554 and c-prime
MRMPPKNDTPERDSSVGQSFRAIKDIGQAVVVVALLAGGVIWWTSRSSPQRNSGIAPPERTVTGADYAGWRKCRECHPREDAFHRRSGHSHTLQAAGAGEPARRMKGREGVDSESPDAIWRYLLSDGQLIAERAEGANRSRQTLEFALGSGIHATTYLTLAGRDGDNRPVAMEHRLTHFTQPDRLDITPGQRAKSHNTGVGPEGRLLSADETMKCLGCHATRLSSEDERNVNPATLIPNVSCERCHGPARAHIEAARRGDDDALAMPFGYAGEESAELNVRLCGQCHRLPEHVPPSEIRPDNDLLARFQPVGLMQSRCYTRSKGAMSCSTCHDPHAPTSRDRSAYEAVCLSCHTAPQQKPCPVNAREKCLDCHMPRRDSGGGLHFSDHWIRAGSR